MSDPDDARASLRHALGLFIAVLKNQPTPDLHAVIVQAPKNDHPRLYPGAELPPLPVSLRGKKWLGAFFIPLVPASKIHYFGDSERLVLFRDLSRVALAALRLAFPDVDSLAGRVLYAGPAGDADHILADFPLLTLRDTAALSPSRRFVMDRWYWTGSAGNLRVPYFEDERKAVGLAGSLPPGVAASPDVTTFTADVFSFSATALDFAIGLLPVPAPSETETPADHQGKRQTETPAGLVTLDQAAASVHRRKRALEYYKSHRKTPLPLPTIEGGGGKPDLWDWKTIRPWLESTFNFKLPETFPANRNR